MNMKIVAKSSGSNWTLNTFFSLNNLFLINWLTSVKETLRLGQEPKAHLALLFFKERFEQLGTKVHKAFSKGKINDE